MKKSEALQLRNEMKNFSGIGREKIQITAFVFI